MNRKFTIFIIILLLLLVAGGVFWWWRSKEPDVGFVSPNEFIQTEVNGEKIIEYKKTGFKIKIPGDWETTDNSGVRLLCTSSDFQLHPEVGPSGAPLPEKGCAIAISIRKEKESTSYDIEYSYLRENIELCLGPEHDCGDYEIIELDKNKAVRYIYLLEDKSISGKYVWVKIPKDEKIYTFEAYLFSQDREKCTQEFDKILQTVEIRK